MPIVELPDNTEIEFPDSMDAATIDQEIRKAFPQVVARTAPIAPQRPLPAEAMLQRDIAALSMPQANLRPGYLRGEAPAPAFAGPSLQQDVASLALPQPSTRPGYLTGEPVPGTVSAGVSGATGELVKGAISPLGAGIVAAHALPPLGLAVDALVVGGMLQQAYKHLANFRETGNREELGRGSALLLAAGAPIAKKGVGAARELSQLGAPLPERGVTPTTPDILAIDALARQQLAGGRDAALPFVDRPEVVPVPSAGGLMTPRQLAGANVAFATPPKRARPVVPETPPEPERGMTILAEIRAAGADTKAKVQKLFPQLSRETAAKLRDQAFPREKLPDNLSRADVDRLFLKDLNEASNREIAAAESTLKPSTAKPSTAAPAPEPAAVPLGFERPARTDPKLSSLDDATFDQQRKSVAQRLDKLETQFDEREFTPAEQTALGQLQDEYTAHELEAFRRSAKSKVSEDIFHEALNLTDHLDLATGLEKLSGSEDFVKLGMLLDELKTRRGDPLVAGWFKRHLEGSADAREVYAGRYQRLRALSALREPAAVEGTGTVPVRTPEPPAAAPPAAAEAVPARAPLAPAERAEIAGEMREALADEPVAAPSTETKPAAPPVETPAKAEPTEPAPEPTKGIAQLRTDLYSGVGQNINDYMRSAPREEVLAKWRTSRKLLNQIDEEMALRKKLGENEKELFPLRYEVDQFSGVLEHKLMTEPLPAPETAAEHGPGIIGMGGATPSEFHPSGQTATAIKNAAIEADRIRMGLPKFAPVMRQKYREAWDQAMAEIDRDPEIQDRLIAELRTKPRALADNVETALLEHRMVDLKNEFAKATRDLAQAVDDGRADAAAEARDRIAYFSDKVYELTEVTKAVGVKWGQTGVGRKQWVDDEFNLVQMVADRRAVRDGQPLSEQEFTDTKTAADAISKAQDRLGKRIAEIQDRISRGDFTEKQKAQLARDPEVERLRYQLDRLQREWREGLIKERMARRPLFRRIVAAGVQFPNDLRAIMTSYDLSALLRQGKFMLLAHPLRTATSIKPMLEAFRSPARALAIENEIVERPNYPLYKASKLYLAEHGASLSQMEEQWMSRWAEKIPGVGASQRAYTAFLNKVRADSFDAMAETLSRNRPLTPDEAKVISHYINVSTGRGTIGMAENAGATLNSVFFAPRYVASRFQLLLGQPLWYGALSGKVPFRGTGAARALVASEYARIFAGVAAVYTLGKLAGAEIETDPRSTDFGKLRFGNTRIDPMAGVQQATVFLSREASGKTKTARNRVVPLTGNVPYGGRTAVDVAVTFGRTKLAPVPGTIIDLRQGKNFAGVPVTVGSEALDLVTPMSLGDIYESMQAQGVPKGAALGVLSIFGENVRSYDALGPKRQTQ